MRESTDQKNSTFTVASTYSVNFQSNVIYPGYAEGYNNIVLMFINVITL